MKRTLRAAAAVTAALVISSCTVKIDNVDSNGELLYRSSRADMSSAAETTLTETEASVSEEPDDSAEEEQGIVMPDDNTLTVLIGDDHEKLLEGCNSFFESLGGELKTEVVDSDLMYDTIAAGVISDSPIDVATFDNGMLFPYFAVNGVAAPIDHEIEMPDLPDNLEDAAELFAINNWHYVFPLGIGQSYRLLYDTETIKRYKLEDPADIPDSEWSTEKLCEMIGKFHERGGEFPISGNYGEPIHISTGSALAIFERDPAGFYNNLFDPAMAETTDMLFLQKQNGIDMERQFASPAEAFREGVLFYSATLFEAEKEPLPDTVKSVAVPTLKELDRYSELSVYGLTLMEASEHKAAAECYFKCAAEYAAELPAGRFADDYRLESLERTVYPYDKGISPGVSYSPAHMNEDNQLAVSPLIYTGLENKEDWGGVCAYYSRLFINDCTALNNIISKDIYGD